MSFSSSPQKGATTSKQLEIETTTMMNGNGNGNNTDNDDNGVLSSSSSSPPKTPAKTAAPPAPLDLLDPVWIRRGGGGTPINSSSMNPHHQYVAPDVLEGVVEYLGPVHFAAGDDDDWAGVRLTGLSEGLGRNDGTVHGRQYFVAPPGSGLFVKRHALSKRQITRREEFRLKRDLDIVVAQGSGNNKSNNNNSGTTTTLPFHRITTTPPHAAAASSSSPHGMSLSSSSSPRRRPTPPASSTTTTTTPPTPTASTNAAAPKLGAMMRSPVPHGPPSNIIKKNKKNSNNDNNEEAADTAPSPAVTNSNKNNVTLDAPTMSVMARSPMPRHANQEGGQHQQQHQPQPPPVILDIPEASLLATSTPDKAAHKSSPSKAQLRRGGGGGGGNRSKKKIIINSSNNNTAAAATSTSTYASPATTTTTVAATATSGGKPPTSPTKASRNVSGTKTTPVGTPAKEKKEKTTAAVAQQQQQQEFPDLLVSSSSASENNNSINKKKNGGNAAPPKSAPSTPSSRGVVPARGGPPQSAPTTPSSRGQAKKAPAEPAASATAPKTTTSRSASGTPSRAASSPQNRHRTTSAKVTPRPNPSRTPPLPPIVPAGERDIEQLLEDEDGQYDDGVDVADPPNISRASSFPPPPPRRRARAFPIDYNNHGTTPPEGFITKTQGWISFLFLFVATSPLITFVVLLFVKPNLFVPPAIHDHDDDDDDDMIQSFYFVCRLVTCGSVLGLVIMQMFLCLPLLGDLLSCRTKVVRPLAVATMRAAAVATAWMALVVVLLAMWLAWKRQQDNMDPNFTDHVPEWAIWVLGAEGSVMLLLALVALMVSFWPAILPEQQPSRNGQAISSSADDEEGDERQPLLTENEQINGDEEAPPPSDQTMDGDAGNDDTSLQDEPHATSRMQGTRRLLQLASSQVCYIYAGCAVLLVRLPFSLAIPHFVSTTITALARGNFREAQLEIIRLLILGSIDAALDFWCVFLFGYANLRITRDLRLDLFSRLLNMEVSFFDRTNTGTLASRLNNDCSAMAADLTWFFRFSIESVVRIAGITAYMLIRSPRLAACALTVVPVVAIVNRYYGRWLHRNAMLVQEALANANAVAQEALANVRTVVAFAAEPQQQHKYETRIQQHYQRGVQQLFMQALYYMTISTFLVNTIVQAALLGVGAYLIERNRLSADVLLAFMLYQGQLQRETLNLFQSYTSLVMSSGAGEKVFALLDRRPPPPAMGSRRVVRDSRDYATGELDDREDNGLYQAPSLESSDVQAVSPSSKSMVTKTTPYLELHGVSFAYPTRPDHMVLNGMNLTVPKGSTVALVGASGCGKTTVINLLQRLYDPVLGAVLVNGVDLRQLDLPLHRQDIGVVSQDTQLFDGTILDNIIFGSSDSIINNVDHEDEDGRRDQANNHRIRQQAIQAAQLAHAHVFVQGFEKGYDTQVGERGVQLSGGQRQRLAIARAIYKKPSLLLLDEATSALDGESEQVVQKALDELLQQQDHRDMTTVVVAHRLKTVQNAHAIAVIDQGRVVEWGNHGQLLRKKGIYRAMMGRATASGVLSEH